jgi:hypothetical protein
MSLEEFKVGATDRIASISAGGGIITSICELSAAKECKWSAEKCIKADTLAEGRGA